MLCNWVIDVYLKYASVFCLSSCNGRTSVTERPSHSYQSAVLGYDTISYLSY